MPNVRSYEEKDKPYVQKVCLENAGGAIINADYRKFILTMFCNYYIECEPSTCFVAVDDNDRAVGYVICAKNFDAYLKRFFKDYFPNIPLKYKPGALAEILAHAIYRKSYPAHLHIDISSEFQRRGLGHRLIDALTAALGEYDVRSVMLVVGSGNEQGRNFYKKYGFKEIGNLSAGIAMGTNF